MPFSFDVLHPGAEQVVLVAFEIEVLSRGMPGQICRIVSTDVYGHWRSTDVYRHSALLTFMDIGALLMFMDTLLST